MNNIFKVIIITLLPFNLYANYLEIKDQSFFKNVNYYETDKLRLNLTDDYYLSIDLKYPGLGSLFKKFNGIEIKIKKNRPYNSEDNKLDFRSLITTSILNALRSQIYEYIENDEITERIPKVALRLIKKAIKQGKLDATEEFLLRSFILQKSEFGKEDGSLKAAEQLALLIKLMVSTDKDLTDIFKILGYIIPSNLFGTNLDEEFWNNILKLQNNNESFEDFIKKLEQEEKNEKEKIEVFVDDKTICLNCINNLGETAVYSTNQFKKIMKNCFEESSSIFNKKTCKFKYDNFTNLNQKNFYKSIGNIDIYKTEKGCYFILKDKANDFTREAIILMKGITIIIKEFLDDYSIDEYNNKKFVSSSDNTKLESPKEYLDNLKLKRSILRNKRNILEKKIRKTKNSIEDLENKDSVYSNFFKKITGSSEKYLNKYDNLKFKLRKKKLELDEINRELKELDNKLKYLDISKRISKKSGANFLNYLIDIIFSQPEIITFYERLSENQDSKNILKKSINKLSLLFNKLHYFKHYWPVVEGLLFEIMPK